MSDDIIQRAMRFASLCHGALNQRRKYTGDPYITHPAAVAAIVSAVPHTDEMIAAAWLHDVVEDTPATIDDVREVAGEGVAMLVEMVTDVSRPADGNRETRKLLDREHIARASPAAKTIKLADLIDNAGSIVAHDEKFARVYIREKALLLDVLVDGDPALHARASRIVREATARLERSLSNGNPG